jgi:hypothetical protein
MKKAKKSEPIVLDIQKDIKEPQKFPWPVKSGSIAEITCANVFEFVPGKLRGEFMDECYRVLVTGGKASFAVRYWNSAAAIQDYLYEAPPLCEQSFLYFNKGWREANGLNRPLKCDFDFTYGYSVDPETAARNDETRSFAIKNYSNCVQVLQVVLTKR